MLREALNRCVTDCQFYGHFELQRKPLMSPWFHDLATIGNLPWWLEQKLIYIFNVESRLYYLIALIHFYWNAPIYHRDIFIFTYFKRPRFSVSGAIYDQQMSLEKFHIVNHLLRKCNLTNTDTVCALMCLLSFDTRYWRLPLRHIVMDE